MRSLKIEKHFSNRIDFGNCRVCPEHKYGFFHNDYLNYTGNSFLEVLSSFAGINFRNRDKMYLKETISHSLSNYAGCLFAANSWFNRLNNIHERDFEKWAKLVVNELYKKDLISPYKYYHYTHGAVGVDPFYFRGKNSNEALKSMAFHHERNYGGRPHGINSHADFIEKFKRFCIRFFGVNSEVNDSYKFLNEIIWTTNIIKEAKVKDAYANSNYYNRRTLIV